MNIREFPLASRWTQVSHAVLPDHVLAQMHPVEAAEAISLSQRSQAFADQEGLDERVFVVNTILSKDLSQQAGCRWLREQQADLNTNIVVLWDAATAIRTTWEIFTAYWDDFCYPSSDNVLVLPASGNWAFFFHHGEMFQFGRRRDG